MLAVDEAIETTAASSRSAAQLVKLNFFAGLSIEEAAGLLGMSVATAYRDWTYARAWLYRRTAMGVRRQRMKIFRKSVERWQCSVPRCRMDR